MCAKRSTKSGRGQADKDVDSVERGHLINALAEVGFVVGTQKAYLREYDRFEGWLDRLPIGESRPSDARRYLTGLKQHGVNKTRFSHASAALKFYFGDVRGVEWRPLSPLRRRMLEDMQLASLAVRTQESYIRSVEQLARYYQRSPEDLTKEDIRQYFVYLTCERKLARPTITIALCGIKFVWEQTLGRDWSLTDVPVPKREKKLPVVLSRGEVDAIISHIVSPRHLACLSLAYACGLRLAEVCRVTVRDIDRERGVLHVRGGKGAKDRYVPLPASVMPLLEACWRSHRNPEWLFPWVGRGGRHAQISDRHVPLSTVQQVFRKAYLASGVSKKATVHSLRHAYATHLLEAGVPIQQIQEWLGHASATTTAVYAHLTKKSTCQSVGTLDRIMDGLGDRN